MVDVFILLPDGEYFVSVERALSYKPTDALGLLQAVSFVTRLSPPRAVPPTCDGTCDGRSAVYLTFGTTEPLSVCLTCGSVHSCTWPHAPCPEAVTRDAGFGVSVTDAGADHDEAPAGDDGDDGDAASAAGPASSDGYRRTGVRVCPFSHRAFDREERAPIVSATFEAACDARDMTVRPVLPRSVMMRLTPSGARAPRDGLGAPEYVDDLEMQRRQAERNEAIKNTRQRPRHTQYVGEFDTTGTVFDDAHRTHEATRILCTAFAPPMSSALAAAAHVRQRREPPRIDILRQPELYEAIRRVVGVVMVRWKEALDLMDRLDTDRTVTSRNPTSRELFGTMLKTPINFAQFVMAVSYFAALPTGYVLDQVVVPPEPLFAAHLPVASSDTDRIPDPRVVHNPRVRNMCVELWTHMARLRAVERERRTVALPQPPAPAHPPANPTVRTQTAPETAAPIKKNQLLFRPPPPRRP